MSRPNFGPLKWLISGSPTLDSVLSPVCTWNRALFEWLHVAAIRNRVGISGEVWSGLFITVSSSPKVQSVLEVFMSGNDIILYSKRKCKDGGANLHETNNLVSVEVH